MGLGIPVRFGFVSVKFLSPSDALCLSTRLSVAAGFTVEAFLKN